MARSQKKNFGPGLFADHYFEPRLPPPALGSKRLWTGPSGSGKTRALLDDFEKSLRSSPDPLAEDFFFVLPSQEHSERIIRLILQRGIPGFFHSRVTTLSRLVKDVFRVPHKPIASPSYRYMILKEILGGKENSFFEGLQNKPGLIQLLLAEITEFKEALISPEEFRVRLSALKRADGGQSEKYETLARVYENYERKLGATGYQDESDLCRDFLRLKAAGQLKLPRFKKLWLDGFFDFSPLQWVYVRELAALTEEMTVTLTKDAGMRRESLFKIPFQTETELKKMGFAGVDKQKPGIGTRRGAEQVLGYAEHYIFSEEAVAGVPDPAGTLAIFESVEQQGEIEMIAREIQNYCRETSARYSDCAILLRHIGPYDAVIRSVFSHYDIPFEIHERPRLKQTSRIQPVLSLLKIFSGGWKRDDLLNFFKSGYVVRAGAYPKDASWWASLELEAQKRAVSSGRTVWIEPWIFSERSPESSEWNALKTKQLQALADLEDRLRGAAGYEELRNVFLEGLNGIFGILSENHSPYPEDAAALQRILSLMEELREYLPGAVTLEKFTEEFIRLAEIDLYSLHHRDKNRVQIYDISMARQKEYKAVFLAGLLEKSFPVLIREDPVLSDWERELFNHGAEKKLRLRLPRQSLERYFFYLAVTRTNDRLYLTYPKLDREGKEALPSFYVDEIQNVFQGRIPKFRQDLSAPYPALDEVRTRHELYAAVMGELWRRGQDEKPLLLCLVNRILETLEGRSFWQRASYRISDGFNHPEILRLDPLRSARTSPTSLEDYAKCAFHYYAEKSLGLKDFRQDVNRFLRGQLIHKALEDFFKARKEKPGLYTSPEAAALFIRSRMPEYLEQYPLRYEKPYRYEVEKASIEEILNEFIRFELARLKETPLQPEYFELRFGREPDPEIPVFEMPSADGAVRIAGVIDRIDVDSAKRKAVVVDYKTSSQFSVKDLAYGTALQLPLYMMVIRKHLGLEPVAGLLNVVKEMKVKGFYWIEEAEKFMKISSAAKGKFGRQEFEAVIETSAGFIRRYVKEMKEGQIRVLPRKCDDFCPYTAVCRIEKWKLESIYADHRSSAGLSLPNEGAS